MYNCSKHILILIFTLLSGFVYSQSTPKIRQLEKERNELHRRISESESLLKSTGNDVKSQLDNLALISGQIDERRRYLSAIQKDINSIQQEINRLEGELKVLNADLKLKREKYEKSLKYLHRNSSIQEKLMFIFSADNLSQMYRRLRYVRQYADFQRLKGEEIKSKLAEIKDKKKVTEETYDAKLALLKHQETEKKKLEEQEADRKKLLASMQKKQRQLKNEIDKQRKAANKLNAEIDRLIAIEIEAARKRAEEERRRKEAEAKKQQPSNKEESKPVTKQMDAYRVDDSDRKLSGTFERNKGRLPIPVTGPYVIVGHYGQYQVEGLRNVRLDNKGIDIKAKQGAMARTIFDGEVTAVFQYNGLANVLVRHGSYISVYCNLESVIVKQGSQLKTRDVIGQISTDSDGNTVLHFQLRKEKDKLNPELWIAK
ncbi:peptidoglycan DD-metalloendopeptidase family protein [Bacteroides caecigallinarum]|uniref:murein hydrolase activator EnvC family protein n=1 Tax=Bacteroides caecigallinarum TaxID=1411144 RepID=UPI0019580F72|nr:peptidoglycan DD-metalloendopeptidase family protein [Bacteroides caecigallinarum]MBM6864763.1 peptidoglycan DD-metalloendopeptidase family protein [Bacteroides caecigallinarum]